MSDGDAPEEAPRGSILRLVPPAREQQDADRAEIARHLRRLAKAVQAGKVDGALVATCGQVEQIAVLGLRPEQIALVGARMLALAARQLDEWVPG